MVVFFAFIWDLLFVLQKSQRERRKNMHTHSATAFRIREFQRRMNCCDKYASISSRPARCGDSPYGWWLLDILWWLLDIDTVSASTFRFSFLAKFISPF